MPFRFRKSIRLGKGFRLNVSKSGISTSIGGHGAIMNIGKRGVKTTVGIPGTGISYSQSSSSGKQQTPSRPSLQSNKSSSGAGCLNGLVGLIAIPFRVLGDLIKSIANPETRRSSLILTGIIGAVGAVAVICLGIISIIGAGGGSNTPTPVNDLISIQNTAQAGVFASFTQTALAAPTLEIATETTIPTAVATSAPLPTATLIPTNTPLPTATIVILLPTNPPAANHPSGTSGQCVDGQYTTAQHKQGACSHHGGVLVWWGP